MNAVTANPFVVSRFIGATCEARQRPHECGHYEPVGQNATRGYPRGLSTTVASGGRQTSIDAGRPWQGISSASMPGPLPRLLPP
jgi:hypothetical protein